MKRRELPGRTLGFATRAIQAEPRERPRSGQPLVTPIYQTTSFEFEDTEAMGDALASHDQPFMYSRVSNPTVAAFEEALAALEGGEAAVGFASGMAAVHGAVTALAGAGDHVVAPRSMYGNSYGLLQKVLPHFGIHTTFVENGDLEAIEAAFTPRTRIVYAETIANPALLVADLPRLAELAHRRGARLVVDSTFASPYLSRPLEHGADLVIHSASKYLGGHGDLIAGAVVGEHALMRRVRQMAIDLGGIMAPFVAWLILRGLKTLALRMERHVASATAVARFLDGRAELTRVLYPGLPSHPDHALATRLLPRGAGGMVGLELEGGRAAGLRFMDRLRLFRLAGSLGDAHSLALQPATTSHRQLGPEGLRAAGISEGFVRLSIGLEDPEDLVADLEQALSGAAG
jgi:methionine-gamma-lyase